MRLWIAAAVALAAASATAAEIPADKRHSDYAEMSAELRRMQDDDSANPGMLWVLDGEELWTRRDGAAAKSCADCHSEAARTMKGVAARYPQVDASLGAPVGLEERINLCHREHQGAAPFPYESKELVALTAYVARQSRGMSVALPEDTASRPFIDAGRALFEQRQGQLNLSCANCHDDNWGRKLGGATIPQGHPNGYPLYRLEWQGLGSLQRRLRNCLTGMRAAPFAYGSLEILELELFLAGRAHGLPIESPAVRP